MHIVDSLLGVCFFFCMMTMLVLLLPLPLLYALTVQHPFAKFNYLSLLFFYCCNRILIQFGWLFDGDAIIDNMLCVCVFVVGGDVEKRNNSHWSISNATFRTVSNHTRDKHVFIEGERNCFNSVVVYYALAYFLSQCAKPNSRIRWDACALKLNAWLLFFQFIYISFCFCNLNATQ